MGRWLKVAVVAAVVSSGAGCRAHEGSYVWADRFEEPPSGAQQDYVLSPGDVIAIKVLNHEELTTRTRIRTDGRISLPYLNDVAVTGQAMTDVREMLQKRLKAFVVNPMVTVSLEEQRPFVVSVMGEVARPGVYTVDPGAGVLQAIASAGGLTHYAHEDRIFVLRRLAPDASPTRVRFDYSALSRAEGRSAGFRLKLQDIVVVE
jgi:polysaccharide export outer membrane protein